MAKAALKAGPKVQYSATGRRKESVARVRLIPGAGEILVNERLFENYFGGKVLQTIIRQPLVETNTIGQFDVAINVYGGGISGQAGAIRHGIARALLKVDPNYRLSLKKAGFLTRDPRMTERKKYGLKKARKRPQFSKR